MLRLAGPVVLAEIGWMSMGLVDTMLVGRVSAEAIGAVSIGSHIFYTVAITGMGMLLGLDYLVSRAMGAGQADDARRALAQGIYLSVGLAVLLIAVLLALLPRLESLGVRPEVAREAVPYLRALTWSTLPLLLYAALRRYLQAVGAVRPVMMALLSANLINAAAAWALIFGRFGLPALGAEGAGWATCFSRLYMFLYLLVYLLRYERRAGAGRGVSYRPDLARLAELARLGLPAALQILLEMGVFAAAALLAARLSPDALAGHQIALSLASFTFMMPLGVSSAAAVRVGHALGRADAAAATRAGWTAVAIGALIMSVAGLTFVAVPHALVRAFTTDAAVISVGVSLLGIAAVFQLFDGLQVVSTGALRGTGDTRTPMVSNLVAHWFIGLPLGYALCFHFGWGVRGLWVGLCTGLIAVALTLIAMWSWRTHMLASEYSAGRSP